MVCQSSNDLKNSQTEFPVEVLPIAAGYPGTPGKPTTWRGQGSHGGCIPKSLFCTQVDEAEKHQSTEGQGSLMFGRSNWIRKKRKMTWLGKRKYKWVGPTFCRPENHLWKVDENRFPNCFGVLGMIHVFLWGVSKIPMVFVFPWNTSLRYPNFWTDFNNE